MTFCRGHDHCQTTAWQTEIWVSQLLSPVIRWSLIGSSHWSEPTKTCEQESLASASKEEDLLRHSREVKKGQKWRKHLELYFTAGLKVSRETESSFAGFYSFLWRWEFLTATKHLFPYLSALPSYFSSLTTFFLCCQNYWTDNKCL